MLLSFSFSNYHSFVDQVDVSFLLTQRDTAEGWVHVSKSQRKVSTVLAVMGANGAGKTSLLKVGQFISSFISDSFSSAPDDRLSFMPHMAHRNEPSSFNVVFEGSEGAEWNYELVVQHGKVLRESLSRKDPGPGARPVRIFFRTVKDDGYEVTQSFGIADSEAAKVRPNVSFISWAKQYGSEAAKKVASLNLISNLDVTGHKASGRGGFLDAAEFFETNIVHREHMRKLITSWDFGLSDIRIENFSAPPGSKGESTPYFFPFGIHRSKSNEFELPFFMESSGTQTAFVLLSKLLPVLASGGIALMDEFEADLHPHMIEPLLRLFHDKKTNPHSAQLIFTCHSPEVLRSLHRAQVMFVEKDDCMSQAYRGDEIDGLTSQHNLYAKYLSGALGAIPQL